MEDNTENSFHALESSARRHKYFRAESQVRYVMNVDHKLYRLADFPVLAQLAKDKTTATQLDSRACRHIYESNLDKLNPAKFSEHEMALIRTLKVNLQPQPMMSCHSASESGESALSTGAMISHRSKYQLSDLLAVMPADTPLTEEEKAWLDMPDVGNEKL